MKIQSDEEQWQKERPFCDAAIYVYIYVKKIIKGT